MNDKYIRLLVLFVIPLLLVSCYVKKPMAYTVHKPDQNGRVIVDEPQLAKKKNFIGYTFDLGVIGGAAYGAYTLAPFVTQKAEGQKPINALNIAAGTIVGMGIVSFSDMIMGKNKRIKTNVDYHKWVKKANKDYNFLRKKDNGFIMYSPLSEKNFVVSNLQDALDYKLAFSGGENENRVFDEATQKVLRNELPELIAAYSDNPNLSVAQKRYITESNNVRDYIAAKRLYNNISLNDEEEIYNRVGSNEEIAMFFELYPNSVYNTRLFELGLKRTNFEDIPPYVLSAPKNVDPEIIKKAEIKYLKSFHNVEKFLTVYTEKYPKIMTKEDAIEYLIATDLLKNLNDIRMIYKKLGYVQYKMEEAITYVRERRDKNETEADKNSWEKDLKGKEYDWINLLVEVPEMNTDLANNIKEAYVNEIKNIYKTLCDDRNASGLEKFATEYRGNAYVGDMAKKAVADAEYYYVIRDGVSLEFRMEYAKKHPELFSLLDSISYKEVVKERSHKAKEYITYFYSGKYIDHVMKLHEMKVEQERLEAARTAAAAVERMKDDDRRRSEYCHLCRGSGKCISCYGKGYITTFFTRETKECDMCKATGICYKCRGTGREYN